MTVATASVAGGGSGSAGASVRRPTFSGGASVSTGATSVPCARVSTAATIGATVLVVGGGSGPAGRSVRSPTSPAGDSSALTDTSVAKPGRFANTVELNRIVPLMPGNGIPHFG